MQKLAGQPTFAKETCVSFGILESGKLRSMSLYCRAMPDGRFASVSSTVMLSSTCKMSNVDICCVKEILCSLNKQAGLGKMEDC